MRTLIGYQYTILDTNFNVASTYRTFTYRSLKYTLKVGKKALADYLDLYYKDISLIGSVKDECDFIKEEGEEIGSWYSYATEDNIKTGTPLAYLVISDVHLCDEESDDEDD